LGAYWDFLRGYTIQSNDEPFMRALLTDEIQANLLAFQKPLEIVYGKIVLKDGSTAGRKAVASTIAPDSLLFRCIRVFRPTGITTRQSKPLRCFVIV